MEYKKSTKIMKNKIMATILLLTVFLPVTLKAFGVISENNIVLWITAFGVYIVTPVVAIRLAFKK